MYRSWGTESLILPWGKARVAHRLRCHWWPPCDLRGPPLAWHLSVAEQRDRETWSLEPFLGCWLCLPAPGHLEE